MGVFEFQSRPSEEDAHGRERAHADRALGFSAPSIGHTAWSIRCVRASFLWFQAAETDVLAFDRFVPLPSIISTILALTLFASSISARNNLLESTKTNSTVSLGPAYVVSFPNPRRD